MEQTKRPKCRNCQKPLAKDWELVRPEKGEPLEIKHYGTRPGYTEAGRWSIGFYGRYGRGGRNLFCTLRCGYEYAVNSLSRKDLEP